MFEGRLPSFANTRSMRVAGGLGTVARVVGDAQEIYDQRISVDDALRRIENLYKPYHRALRRLFTRVHREFGAAMLVDCHSMPSSTGPKDERPRADVVLGDRYGTSCVGLVSRGDRDDAAPARLRGQPQQALRRRLHHRALRQPGRGPARDPDRVQPRALHGRAPLRAHGGLRPRWRPISKCWPTGWPRFRWKSCGPIAPRRNKRAAPRRDRMRLRGTHSPSEHYIHGSQAAEPSGCRPCIPIPSTSGPTSHVFLGEQHSRNERRTWFVVALTAIMMVGEIAGGTIFGSMALLADGWHMATHAAALGIAAGAYVFARRQARNPSVRIRHRQVRRPRRVFERRHSRADRHPDRLRKRRADDPSGADRLWRGDRDRRAGARREPRSAPGCCATTPHRSCTRARPWPCCMVTPTTSPATTICAAAYVHVLADAATSVLAILALVVAMSSQWVWIDPLVGIIGSLVIAGVGLWVDPGLRRGAARRGARHGGRERDPRAPGNRAATGSPTCICGRSVRAIAPRSSRSVSDRRASRPPAYKQRLADVPRLSHVTVEVEQCRS